MNYHYLCNFYDMILVTQTSLLHIIFNQIKRNHIKFYYIYILIGRILKEIILYLIIIYLN